MSTLGFVAACAVGCASTPIPSSRVASVETAVRAARDGGAERVPAAKTPLNSAEGQLGEAKNLISKGDNDEASAKLTRAELDAALASALTREAQQTAATQAAYQRVRAMAAPPSQMNEEKGQ
jgi:hypothetical protein